MIREVINKLCIHFRSSNDLFATSSVFCFVWFMRESMALHVRRPGTRRPGSCQGGLNFQGLQSLMAAPLLAASHEEALRNVRKLLRAELWPGGSTERSLNWDWHWDMSHWDNRGKRSGEQNLAIHSIKNKIKYQVFVSRLQMYKLMKVSRSVGGDIYEQEPESWGKLWAGEEGIFVCKLHIHKFANFQQT